jgi:flavin-dependent dehydrogenase
LEAPAATYDLIVIGGGPAGSSAAITAARLGARVLLLERNRFPRHKVCGEFVSAESLQLLSTLLPGDSKLLRDGVCISATRIFLDGHTVHTAINPPAVSIARFDLDEALWKSAQESGVETCQLTTVLDVSGSGPFEVRTSKGTFCARSIVNASGRWSNLTAAVTPKENAEKWLGVKGHFSEPNPPASVDLYFFDGGYCGVQPVNMAAGNHSGQRVNACAMVRAGVATTLPGLFALHPALLERSRRWAPLSEPVTTSPLIFREPQPVRDRILQAGDAATFVDPFIGDGISLALRGGALAAQSLRPFLQNEISLAEASQNYARSYRQGLAPAFHNSSKLRRMLRLPQAVRKPFVFVLGKSPSLASYLVRKTR